jgi:anaerobic selenocysteine-containing dehydrogenase
VAEHVTGVDELRALAAPWTPEKVAETCGCDVSDVVNVSELFAKHGTAGVYDGLGVEHHGAGVDTVRLVASLVALCGYADEPQLHDRASPRFADEAVPAILRVDEIEPAPPPPAARPVGFDEHRCSARCTARRRRACCRAPSSRESRTPCAGSSSWARTPR